MTGPLILDASPIAFRAEAVVAAELRRATAIAHGLPETMQARQLLEHGVEVPEPSIAAVTAQFYVMAERLLGEWGPCGGRPTHGAAVLDPRGRTWRHDCYPLYKAGRPPKPAGVTAALAEAPAIFQALGMPVLSVPGYEADDVICSLVHRHDGCVVVSSDKDFLQFFGVRGSRQWDPTRRAEGDPPDAYPGVWLTEQHVYDKFGVDPRIPGHLARVVEVQALTGDTVDHVPGCPGVGIVTAARLIEAFDTVEALYTALHAGRAMPKGIGPAMVTKLRAGEDDARLSRALVELRRDLDVSAPALRAPDPHALQELVRRFGWAEAAGVGAAGGEAAAA